MFFNNYFKSSTSISTSKHILIFCLLVCLSNAEASLVSTQRTNLKSIDGWTIVAKSEIEVISCRAEKERNNGDKYILIYTPSLKYRNSSWYLGVVSRNHSLPKDVLEVDANITAKENNQMLVTGKILKIGDSKGGKMISSYIRVEFLNFKKKIEDLKKSKNLSIHSRKNKEITLKLPNLKSVLEGLESCYKKMSTI